MDFLHKVSRVGRLSLAHACAHAFQQRCCFFAVTSVTLGGKVGREIRKNSRVNCALKHFFFDSLAIDLGQAEAAVC